MRQIVEFRLNILSDDSSDIPHGEECASNRRGSITGMPFTESRGIHYSEKTMWNVEERF